MSKPLIRKRQTKILATLGPASNTEEMIEKLFLAGVDNFRLNFSHGTHEDHANRVKMIRAVEARHGRPIGIVADMQGPKLRVGKFKDGTIDLVAGMVIRLDLDKTEGDAKRVNLPHPEIISSLDVGAFILCDDGKVRMKIVGKGSDYLEELNDKEEDFIDRAVNPRINSRLGCQCVLLDGSGEVAITLPDQTQFLGE